MKPQRRFTDHGTMEPSSVMALPSDHPAVVEGRTLFPTTVVDPLLSPRLLISGANQRKLGDRVAKGPWRGMPIYTLTLEERATCPPSCLRWRDCMGAGMPFSRRHKAGMSLENLLWGELDVLAARHRDGFVVRLHILGDFYSIAYAELWMSALITIPALRLFGYTARNPSVGIGYLIAAMNQRFPERCAIRFSRPEPGPMRAVTIDRVPESPRVDEGIVCPAQTGATECCGTCGLCWAPVARDKTIVFVLHGRKPAKGQKKSTGPYEVGGVHAQQHRIQGGQGTDRATSIHSGADSSASAGRTVPVDPERQEAKDQRQLDGPSSAAGGSFRRNREASSAAEPERIVTVIRPPPPTSAAQKEQRSKISAQWAGSFKADRKGAHTAQDADMIARFLAEKGTTPCPTRFADGGWSEQTRRNLEGGEA